MKLNIFQYEIRSGLFQLLTQSIPIFPSYRNQPIDWDYKSIDWFLYDGNTALNWVNPLAGRHFVK